MSNYGLAPMDWQQLGVGQQQALLRRPAQDPGERRDAVRQILQAVRQQGDAALMEMTRRFDGIEPRQFEYNREELANAWQRIDQQLGSALQQAADNIRRFHAADRPLDKEVETVPGLTCSVRYLPYAAVGLYVPGGSAPLVSTALMLAIPAQLAGCDEIILCSPPAANGRLPDEILAAAHLCGVDRVFCVGGAQAIAAMAYGTDTVPRCQKIYGPGNAWVTEAKQQVAQDPAGAAIDMPAGPSEVLVIADAAAAADGGAELIAWDLLSQAEHGPDSQVLLLTDSRALADEVIAELERLGPESPRADILQHSLAASRIICVADLETAVEVSEDYAPEHLIINTRNAAELAARVRNAGSVFIGRWTPESLGDYCSGTNHVLPTYGWARSHGALGMGDYLRRMTLQEASPAALQITGPVAERLAAFEGLDAHRMAVSARLRRIAADAGKVAP